MSGVYLIKSPYEGITMLKVGFSKNCPKRIKTHISSNPLCFPYGYIETDNYKWLEKDIHFKCRFFRYKNTEWFREKEELINFFTEHKNFKNYDNRNTRK